MVQRCHIRNTQKKEKCNPVLGAKREGRRAQGGHLRFSLLPLSSARVFQRSIEQDCRRTCRPAAERSLCLLQARRESRKCVECDIRGSAAGDRGKALRDASSKKGTKALIQVLKIKNWKIKN